MKTPFFDTSILVGGLIDFGESSRAPMAVLDRLTGGGIAGASTAWHCCLEFFSVVTRLPAEYRLEPHDAEQLVEDEIRKKFRIHGLPASSRSAFFKAAVADGIRGGRIYDRYIGQIALGMKATVLVTGNKRHFDWLNARGLPVLDAAEYLDLLTG